MTAAGRKKVILSYPRWMETKFVWQPTKRSYFLEKLEPMAAFKKLPVSHTEKAAKKATYSLRGDDDPASEEEDE